MTGIAGPLALGAPWVLAGLAVLPALWWLLRFTPPPSRRVAFPPARLLAGLTGRDETPARTPWWLLALRLAAAALIILGLAQPVLRGGMALYAEGPVVLVVDDGWAAGADWGRRLGAAVAVTRRAERAGRSVVLVTTAPRPDGSAAPPPEPATPAAVRRRLRALAPKPWPVDREAAADRVAKLDGPAHAVWVSDGLTHDAAGAARDLAGTLQRLGALTVLTAGRPAPLVRPPRRTADGFRVSVARAAGPAAEHTMVARDSEGRVLGRTTVAFDKGAASATATLALPVQAANRAARLDLADRPGAGGVALLDARWQRRPVGLVAGGRDAVAPQPLLDPLYYTARALGPQAVIRRPQSPTDGLSGLSVLVLADVAGLDAATRERLGKWVRDGGVLVRFAGPRLAARPDPLLPVALRRQGRSLGGTVSWTEPMSLAPFPSDSPFGGLAPGDVTVERQVLAEPAADMTVWARLEDGTPLVTARKMGRGRLVLVHVTAGPAWSDLPLSGVFPDMMRRLTRLGGGAGAGAGAGGPLAPRRVLNGRGRLTAPGPAATAIPTGAGAGGTPGADITPGPAHPPGLYGAEGTRRALNLGGTLPAPAALTDLPPGVARGDLASAEAQTPLAPWLFAAAFVLLLADTLVAARLRGLLGGAAAVALLAAAPGPAGAADLPDEAPPAALKTRLAYIPAGDSAVDRLSRAGLRGLTQLLARRTAVEMAPPDAVAPGDAELPLYPLVYWPVTAATLDLKPAARRNVRRYLAHGGMILADTRGGVGGDGPPRGVTRLARALDRPPLVELPDDHVLRRSYYLLDGLPGRWRDDTLWLARPAARGARVGGLLAGRNAWAAAWAVGPDGAPLEPTLPGGEAQREMARRFGVNVVMYALTGTYKADQVHVDTILERLEGR